MYIQFLVEDISAGELIKIIMAKYNAEKPPCCIEFDVRSYKGIGGFPKGKSAKNAKAEQLLNDLPKRLNALNASLKCKDSPSIFVVLDNDTRDTEDFAKKLNEIITREKISVDTVFCIAVEEMEAWLLGDYNALRLAYPPVSGRIASKHSGYSQDSICGTWEFLADMLTENGMGSFMRQNPTAFDIGRCKSQWAKSIGAYMDIRANASPSFQSFIEALDARVHIS
ncbi:MAG: DUF4276 family protein [Oscillospiraceae bacterium]